MSLLRGFNRLLVVLCIGLLALPVSASSHQRAKLEVAAPPPEAVVVRMIVKLRKASSTAASSVPGTASSMASSTTTTTASAGTESRIASLAGVAGMPLHLHRAMSGDASLIDLPAALSAADAEALADRLRASPIVEYAAPDYLRHATITGSINSPPNDPNFSQQWSLMSPSSIFYYNNGASITPITTVGGANLLPAWSISTGSTSTVIAIIDTGVLPHTDLNSSGGSTRLLPGYDFITDPFINNEGGLGRNANSADPGDWISDSDVRTHTQCQGQKISDSSWHGTHVAGIAAATINNSIGIAGIDGGARILPLRVLGKCGGFDSDIIDAVRWAAGFSVTGVPANPYRADVINLSLGGSGSCTSAYQAAFNDAYAAGVTVVIATGNEYARTVDAPANCNHVIAVTAHTVDGLSSIFANTGSQTTLSAPGGGPGTDPSGNQTGNDIGVISLGDTGLTAPVGSNTYMSYEGTSQATPHVTGTVALIRGLLPTASPDRILRFLTSTVRGFPAGSWCTKPSNRCGAGLLDTGAAVSAANQASLTNHAPQATLMPTQTGQAGLAMTFTLTGTDADNDSLTFQAVNGSLPSGATLSASGVFNWPSPVIGKYTMTYRVSDGIAYSPAQDIVIDIAAAPPAPAGGSSGGGSTTPDLWLLLAMVAWHKHRRGTRHTR
jgi:serine protease